MNVGSCSYGDISGRYGLLLAGGHALVCCCSTVGWLLWNWASSGGPYKKVMGGPFSTFFKLVSRIQKSGNFPLTLMN